MKLFIPKKISMLLLECRQQLGWNLLSTDDGNSLQMLFCSVLPLIKRCCEAAANLSGGNYVYGDVLFSMGSYNA